MMPTLAIDVKRVGLYVDVQRDRARAIAGRVAEGFRARGFEVVRGDEAR